MGVGVKTSRKDGEGQPSSVPAHTSADTLLRWERTQKLSFPLCAAAGTVEIILSPGGRFTTSIVYVPE